VLNRRNDEKEGEVQGYGRKLSNRERIALILSISRTNRAYVQPMNIIADRILGEPESDLTPLEANVIWNALNEECYMKRDGA
jgi:hypothetical protein